MGPCMPEGATCATRPDRTSRSLPPTASYEPNRHPTNNKNQTPPWRPHRRGCDVRLEAPLHFLPQAQRGVGIRRQRHLGLQREDGVRLQEAGRETRGRLRQDGKPASEDSATWVCKGRKWRLQEAGSETRGALATAGVPPRAASGGQQRSANKRTPTPTTGSKKQGRTFSLVAVSVNSVPPTVALATTVYCVMAAGNRAEWAGWGVRCV